VKNPRFPRRLNADGSFQRPKARSWNGLPSPQQERKRAAKQFRDAPEAKPKGGCGCRKVAKKKTRKWGN
jgi:hypothetical protein